MAQCSNTILFLESSNNIGGQELQLLQQMQELNHLGCKTKLLCKPQVRIHDFAISKGLDVQALSFRNALHVPSIIKVIKNIYALNPSALICHSGHDAVVGAIAARIVGLFYARPRIIRMRTYQPCIPSSFTYNYLFDQTYTPSEYLRKKILNNKKIKSSKVGVLYPGINFKILDETYGELSQGLMDWFKNQSGPIISHGAMLRGEKGHAVIINALPQVIERFPDLRYVIAGEGSIKQELLSLVRKLGLDEHVYFAGMVQPIATLLRITDLAILPSLMEPLGMFQIESQYLGIPTLASDVDGIPETLINEKTGLLVQAGNSDAWARQIIWALTHLPQMQEWAKQGSLFVKNKFSMTANTQHLLKIIHG